MVSAIVITNRIDAVAFGRADSQGDNGTCGRSYLIRGNRAVSDTTVDIHSIRHTQGGLAAAVQIHTVCAVVAAETANIANGRGIAATLYEGDRGSGRRFRPGRHTDTGGVGQCTGDGNNLAALETYVVRTASGATPFNIAADY